MGLAQKLVALGLEFSVLVYLSISFNYIRESMINKQLFCSLRVVIALLCGETIHS
jgi:hypothetical protein